MTEALTELPDDMEVIGPGKMLKQARKDQGLSIEQVAERLNFRVALVTAIEQEVFDQTLPATYNRGYLKNYAKLVGLDETDILQSYEALSIAKIQEAEMQSFSRGTEKRAANNRLMWSSYFILAILIALTVMWWLQSERQITKVADIDTEQSESSTNVQPAENLSTLSTDETKGEDDSLPLDDIAASDIQEVSASKLPDNSDEPEPIVEDDQDTSLLNTPDSDGSLSAGDEIPATQVDTLNDDASVVDTVSDATTTVRATFDFSGDCWVNIFDATGERLAWGVKKSGYVMTIDGVPPLSITLGKPELVSINYDGTDIEMSQFRQGQIAKFDLPVVP